MGYLVSNDIFFATNFVVFSEKKLGIFYKKISVTSLILLKTFIKKFTNFFCNIISFFKKKH